MRERYHPVWVAAHWLAAILIFVSLYGGIAVLREVPNNVADKPAMLAGHAIAGLVILALMLLRLLLRATTSRLPPADLPNPWLNRLRRTVHVLLYFTLIAMASTGLGTLGMSGALPVVFGEPGTLPADFWAFPPRQGHWFFSRLLLVLVALHVAGALYHQFVRRDGLLARMWFGRRARVAATRGGSARA
jgi:cytochrome b561